ncbi:MAG: hypothetical protein J0I19_02490 [Alphaproteobacteria bacterium]|nr:hypothetical protein [Alphaproteobacteria bacterium]
MKLMRGYRFRREAFTMLRAFLLVFLGAFFLEALSDWSRGRSLGIPLAALAVSALIFMLLAAVLLIIDAGIRAHERKHGVQYPAPRATEP